MSWAGGLVAGHNDAAGVIRREIRGYRSRVISGEFARVDKVEANR